MNKLVFIFIMFVCNSLVLCSCGPAIMKHEGPQIDEVLQPYVNEYKADKKRFLGTSSIRRIDISFFTLTSPIIGQCTRYNSGYREIKVDPIYWFFNASDAEKQILMYHELGHCDLNKEHDDSKAAIMNSNIMDGYQFIMNTDYYIEQLFRK